MKCICFCLFFLFSVVFTLSGYQWPSKNVRIVRHFGQNYQGNLSFSLDLDGNFKEVYPVKDGKILFLHSQNDNFFPTREKSTVIVGQDDGISVVYTGLDEVSTGIIAHGKDVFSQSLLGLRSPNGVLSLVFYDFKTFQCANPLLFLPKLYPRFFQTLKLENIYLRNGNDRSYNVMNEKFIPAGNYEVYVSIFENFDGKNLIPYQVELDFMGDIVRHVSFDAIAAYKGQVFLKGQKKIFEKELYDRDENLFLGKLNILVGQSFLTLRINSANGLRGKETLKIISY